MIDTRNQIIFNIKNFLLFAFLSVSNISLIGQNFNGERRVYFLDATYSMISPNKIWDQSKNNLINSIKNIEDENTEIVVIAFADDINTKPLRWDRKEETANEEGKKKLIKWIKELKAPENNTMTNLHRPIDEFVNNERKEGKVNYMFLLTDGEHERGKKPEEVINQWKETTDELTYGFLVELVPTRNESLKKAINQHDRIWTVQSADVDLNLIRINNNIIYNIRNDEAVEISLSFQGKDENILKSISKPTIDSIFKISEFKIEANKIILSIESEVAGSDLKEEYHLKMKFDSIKQDKTFLLNPEIDLFVINRKERLMNIPLEEIKGKSDKYNSFLWLKGKETPFEISIPLKFSKDAKSDKSTFASFEFVDNFGNPIDDENIIIKVNGHPYSDVFKITPEDKNLNISIQFSEQAEEGLYEGAIRLKNHKLNRINNLILEGNKNPEIIRYKIKNDSSLNPLAKLFFFCGVLIVIILTLWFGFVRKIVYKKFSNFSKTVIVKKDGQIIDQFTVNFKGAKKVVFSDTLIKQSKLNRIFTRKILTYIKPYFTMPLTFVPINKRMSSAYGNGYYIKPNPIPYAGIAEIKNNKIKIEINLR